MTLAIDFSWRDGAVVHGPDRHAWAEVVFRVAGRTLEAVDMRLRTIHSSVTTSLLPFCEWLVDVWPRLIEERTLAPQVERMGWEPFHCLRFGAGGGPMPDVELRRSDDSFVEITAREDVVRPPGIDLSFCVSTQATAPIDAVARELARVMDGVLARLKDGDPWTFDHLSSMWTRAQSTESLIAGRLGLAMHQLDALLAEDREALLQIVADPSLLLLCEATPTWNLARRLEVAKGVRAMLPAPDELQPMTEEWRGLQLDPPGGPPWRQGWRATEQFRSLVADFEEPPGERLPQLLMERLGWRPEHQVRAAPGTSVFDMVVVAPPEHLPTTLTWVGGETARRFRLAKTVYYALTGKRGELKVDTVRTPRHSAANAFAAELLAPRAFLVRNAPQDGFWSEALVMQLARHCAVDVRVIEHQIANRELGVIAA